MPRGPHAKTPSILLVVAIYGAAVAAAVGALGALGTGSPLLDGALAYGVSTLVVFAGSLALDNSSVYDPYWSVGPPLLGVYWASGDLTARQLLVLSLVLLWGARLTWSFFRGWPGLRHEDWRYVDLRRKTGRAYWLVSLLGIHGFPSVMTFLGSLPMLAVLESSVPLGGLDVVAGLLTLGAIAIEATADAQLHRFRRRQPPPGTILREGIWAWSRHPNYFGEITFWWGLALFARAAEPDAVWPMTGATAITALFVTISIPMIERRMASRRPGWAEHQRRVPVLVPMPPRDR